MVGLLAGAAIAVTCVALASMGLPSSRSLLSSFDREVEGAFEDAPSELARATLVDEWLADVERRLARGAQLPSVSMRLALLAGAALVVGFGIRRDFLDALLVLPGTFVGLSLAWRSARNRPVKVAHQRAAVDALVAARVPKLIDLPLPSSRLRRRRRHRGAW
jgi:hypothetical protein